MGDRGNLTAITVILKFHLINEDIFSAILNNIILHFASIKNLIVLDYIFQYQKLEV